MANHFTNTGELNLLNTIKPVSGILISSATDWNISCQTNLSQTLTDIQNQRLLGFSGQTRLIKPHSTISPGSRSQLALT